MSKVKSMFIIFFDIKGILHKEFVLAGQTVNSAYYCDFLWRLRENMRRLRPKLWRQITSCLLHYDSAPSYTSFFTKELLTKKQHDSHGPIHPTILFPRLNVEVKGHHFDKVEVVDAESQAVLKTLTEHDLQDAFKNCTRAGNCAYARKGTTSRVIVASRPKVSF
jgi:hypothetical protein